MPGLRDYKVQLDEGGTWTTVASVTNEFFNRMELLSFPSVTATGVQVTISSINAGGVAGGQVPWFWNSLPERRCGLLGRGIRSRDR